MVVISEKSLERRPEVIARSCCEIKGRFLRVEFFVLQL